MDPDLRVREAVSGSPAWPGRGGWTAGTALSGRRSFPSPFQSICQICRFPLTPLGMPRPEPHKPPAASPWTHSDPLIQPHGVTCPPGVMLSGECADLFFSSPFFGQLLLNLSAKCKLNLPQDPSLTAPHAGHSADGAINTGNDLAGQLLRRGPMKLYASPTTQETPTK